MDIKRQLITKKNFYIMILAVTTYLICCLLIIAFPFKYHDPDSSAYSYIGQKYAFVPFSEWCAPEWWGHADRTGWFQDHPPGIFWGTGIFIHLGIPGHAAPRCANLLYMFLTLFVIFNLVKYFRDEIVGWGAVFAYFFTPVFFQFILRANHEPALNLAFLMGLYGFVRSEQAWSYQALFIISLVCAVLIKGISGLVLLMLGLVYWMCFSRSKKALLTFLMAIVAAIITLVLFDLWYKTVTKDIFFWKNYIFLQGGITGKTEFFSLQKIYNLVWYGGRILWFSFPWIFFVIYFILKMKSDRLSELRDKFMGLCLLSASAILIFYSLFGRKADRYIFSSYCFLALAGASVLIHLKPRLRHFLQMRIHWLPFYLSVLMILLVILVIYFSIYHYRFINLWPG